MVQQSHTDDSPGAAIFPEYATLYDLILSEVEGLSDVQLDFVSERWEWSKWSIRRQLSHMASLKFHWLLVRWGDTLFPNGDHGVQDIRGLINSKDDRMDADRYRETPVILEKLKEAIDLTRRVLVERSVGFLRDSTYLKDKSSEWHLMSKAHPTGFSAAADPAKEVMTLEATIRHMYFEEITHLYNIQRLKRAQGLRSVADLPRVGYWVVEGWDNSEPT